MATQGVEVRTELDAPGRLRERRAIGGVPPARLDPLGDYTVELFKVADGIKPAAGATLRRATSCSGDYNLDTILDGCIELATEGNFSLGPARAARRSPVARSGPASGCRAAARSRS
jgi:hypothetical protein